MDQKTQLTIVIAILNCSNPRKDLQFHMERAASIIAAVELYGEEYIRNCKDELVKANEAEEEQK